MSRSMPTLPAGIRRGVFAIAVCLAVSGCGLWQAPERVQSQPVPEQFVRGGSGDSALLDWLSPLDSQQLGLRTLVFDALAHSATLQQEAARLEQAQANLRIARADRWPTADLNLRGSRSAVGRNQVAQSGQLFNLTLGIGFDPDIWGQLSEAQRSAALSYAAAQARYAGSRRQLAADVTAAVFNTIEAQQLLVVFEQRRANVAQSVAVVEAGYQAGLNEALDLYLAQNSLEQEISNIAGQEQAVLEASAQLQRLLVRYPDGGLELDASLPVFDGDIVPAGLPSDLLVRRADLAEAWLNVLAADADVAVAQRARLPQLSLSGSGGRVSSQLANIISDGDKSWSLVANVAGPLLDGGRRRAAAARAQARARELEQIYVNQLYQAFADVENALSRATSLRTQHDALVKAELNASAALDLALEQYQRGLVDFTTVLESQRRAFDATTSVVRLRNQRVQNRIALHLALGGEFETDQSQPTGGNGQ